MAPIAITPSQLRALQTFIELMLRCGCNRRTTEQSKWIAY